MDNKKRNLTGALTGLGLLALTVGLVQADQPAKTHYFSFAQKVAADWKQIGDAGDWSHTVAMTGMNGYIWSIEGDGTLFRTDKAGE